MLKFLYNFLLNYFYFPIYNKSIKKQKNAKLLIIGLDNSGKTSLLYYLKYKKIKNNLEPTRHPSSEEFIFNNINYKAFDLGGHKLARILWKNYLHNIDIVIFVVDSTDHERIYEVKNELSNIIDIKNKNRLKIPILILGNKIDLQTSINYENLKYVLDFEKYNTDITLIMCSITKNININQGFHWISQFI